MTLLYSTINIYQHHFKMEIQLPSSRCCYGLIRKTLICRQYSPIMLPPGECCVLSCLVTVTLLGFAMTSGPMSPMYIPHVSESLSIVELWPNYGPTMACPRGFQAKAGMDLVRLSRASFPPATLDPRISFAEIFSTPHRGSPLGRCRVEGSTPQMDKGNQLLGNKWKR